MKRKIILPLFILLMGIEIFAQSNEKSQPTYLDITKPLDARVADLVSNMTLAVLWRCVKNITHKFQIIIEA